MLSDPQSPASPSRVRWTFAVDVRDIVAAAGAVLIGIGACAIHWAFGIIVVGAALLGLAWRLAR